MNRILTPSFPALILAAVFAVRLAAPVPCLAAEPASAAAGTNSPAAKLLALFKSKKDVTNSLGAILVYVPEGYRVGRTEVTQAEYQQVMGANPSRFQDANRPVERVEWEEANEFCRKLTDQERQAGKLPKSFYYSLPTDAQWDNYVAKAETKDAITSWLGDRRETEPVGGLPANSLGLHDVRGNVWEWTTTPLSCRGASWRSFEDYLAIAVRYQARSGVLYDDIGFRVVLLAEPDGQ